MEIWKLCLGACAAAALSVSAAGAAVFSALAQNDPNGTLEDFSIYFNDTNGDSLLGFSEITSFSGVTFGSKTFDDVTYLGASSTFVTNGDRGSPTLVPCIALVGVEFWSFANSDGAQGQCVFGPGFQFSDPSYIYSIDLTQDAPAVPLPAGLPLVLTGLGGFWLMRRKKTA